MTHVVEHVEELTREWLSQVLERDVRSVAAERIGTGQTGATYRLVVDADDLPPTLVAKLAAGDADARRRVRDGYRNEVGFYADLVSTLDVRTPRCWYAAISDDGANFTLLLEDLSHFEPGVQCDGCSVAQAEDAVGNLAGLHAARWSDDSLFELRFLHRPTERVADFLHQVMVSSTEEFLRRYSSDLDAGEIAVLRRCAESTKAWQLARPEPFAVIHGDYRLDNLLFPSTDEGVVVVDWQSLLVGPPLRDVAYFLGTSLLVEDRRAAEHELVASYHAELVARGVGDYGLDRCFDDYRLGQLQGPMTTVLGSTFATATRSASADDMFLAMIRRSCAAISELESLDVI